MYEMPCSRLGPFGANAFDVGDLCSFLNKLVFILFLVQTLLPEGTLLSSPLR